MVETELGRLCTNNYRDKKMIVMLHSRNAEIVALKSQLEETQRLLAEATDRVSKLLGNLAMNGKARSKKPKVAFGRRRRARVSAPKEQEQCETLQV
jgi:hypothetical protein